MRELLILSGKGGCGKTSLAGSFVAMAEGIVTVDCDVDAADLHLLLDSKKKVSEDFYSGEEAFLDPQKCIGCGKCLELCRFGAVRCTDDNIFAIDSLFCEGCGVCADNCPVDAVEMKPRNCGELYSSETKYGPFIHAKLGVGGENSGKLVSSVRKKAQNIAKENNLGLIIIDGPPGIGCPVIASLSGVTDLLVITEPTVSGVHDLERVLKLAAHFKVPAMVCVNKADLNLEKTEEIKKMAESSGGKFLGNIQYDNSVTEAQVMGKPVVEVFDNSLTNEIKQIWNKVLEVFNG